MNTDLEVMPVERLRALGDPLRWRIVELLAAEELCVCHLVELLDAPQSLVSHHLRVLRKEGLVESERFRYWTYYRLRSDALASIGRSITRLIEAEPPDGRPRRPCC
jgi:ArsR family transcriptional regulator, arsenate/arsenite/antimonite-responsive transcriptional repressor